MNGREARIVAPTPEALLRAAGLLRGGRLVAFPTETVYGLGADAGNGRAVGRIFDVKRRPGSHPLIVHVASTAAAKQWSRVWPRGATALAEAFWPGPLTLIVPRAAHVVDAVTGGQDSIGLRVPAHPVAQSLLAAFESLGGSGIAGPSANRFGHVSPTTAAHVDDDLGADVDMIVDGGACDVGIESTIVAFVDDEPVLMRPGFIGMKALERVLRVPLQTAHADAPRASGTLASHYAPRTPAYRVAADALRSEIALRSERDERCAVLARTAHAPEGFDGTWMQAPEDARGYAHGLYANLRSLDDARADAILIESIPESAEWFAIGDRLSRATRREDAGDGIDDTIP
jgi:L-threonylcarbamoyladenylate synthase